MRLPPSLGLAYAATVAVLVAWWLGLQATARAGGGATVVLAFAAPAAVWAALATASRTRRRR